MTSLAARAPRLREGDQHSAGHIASAQETSAILSAVHRQTHLAPGHAALLSELAITLFPQKIWTMCFSGLWAFLLSPEPSRGAANAGGCLDKVHRTMDSAGGGTRRFLPVLRPAYQSPLHSACPGVPPPQEQSPIVSSSARSHSLYVFTAKSNLLPVI